MGILRSSRCIGMFVFTTALAGGASVCSAQIIESVGTRAIGMGGAFVAVASDSTATWWNPAGLATGPFSDVSLGRAVTDVDETLPAWRDRVSWFAATAPAIGFSYYRLRITDIRVPATTAQGGASREDPRDEVSVRSFSANALGLTVVQSLLPGIHAGATLKYVRGTVRGGAGNGTVSPSDLLDQAEDLGGGAADNKFDLDIGLMAVAGPVRLGAVMRNALEPKFGHETFTLPRQTRVGAAVDLASAGGPPLTLAIDADAGRYTTVVGDRRVIAIGAEQWFATRRFGIRAGGRFNRVGARERVATAGASVAVRNGLYVEGQLTRGGTDAERGWGIGTRVTF